MKNGPSSNAAPLAGPQQRRPSQYEDEFDSDMITDEAKPLPDRLLLFAEPGWGKSSFAAQADDPLFVMTKGEDGVLTLVKHRQITPVRHFPKPAATWRDLLRAIQGLLVKNVTPGHFVLDTLNGAEKLCQEHICQTIYGGDWGEKGFLAFQRGYDMAAKEWPKLLEALDQLRTRGAGIICLCHAKVVQINNPSGVNYVSYAPDLHAKTWEVTRGWPDLTLRGATEIHVDPDDSKAKIKRGKATGGSHRVLYCQLDAVHQSKNRHGLPEEIDCGDSAVEAWANFQAALNPTAEE